MDKTLQFVIPALMGVESTVAYELKKLGLLEVKAENGRVLCQGSPADIPRININLRTRAPVRRFRLTRGMSAGEPWHSTRPFSALTSGSPSFFSS